MSASFLNSSRRQRTVESCAATVNVKPGLPKLQALPDRYNFESGAVRECRGRQRIESGGMRMGPENELGRRYYFVVPLLRLVVWLLVDSC